MSLKTNDKPTATSQLCREVLLYMVDVRMCSALHVLFTVCVQ